LIALDSLCKILIVDDEYLLRQGIKHLVDWKKEGFDIVGEASNGKEALSLVETLKPHIVISDIVMPVMDGLDLVKLLKEKYPEIQIVILSGYSDFNYVKGTFKLGVNDYILKPKLNPEEVLSLLKNIAGNIPNLVISASKNDLDISCELSKLVSGFQTDIKKVSESFPSDSFVLVGTDIKKLYSKSTKELLQVRPFLLKKLRTYLKSYTYFEVDINKDLFIVLINFQKNSYPLVIEGLKSILQDVSINYPNYYLALSSIFNSLESLKDEYSNNFKPLFGYRFFLKNKNLIPYAEIQKNSFKEKFDFKYYSQMVYALDITAALNYLKQYISSSIVQLSINEYELKTLFQNALYNVINILDELRFDVEEINRSKIEYFQRIDDTKYAEELLDVFEDIEKDISNLLLKKEMPMTDEIINKITQYISKHYNEQLTLKEIADKFHFNYYYLSSYFSSQVAEGFSEYLNKIRVEKALELLRKEDIPVSEVSYLVGYSDHSYFCKVFKKFTKVTPSKFRKNTVSSKRGTYEQIY
jgi:two-component system response regulator YesN